MAFITFERVGIKAVAACVPPKKMFNKDLGYLISEEEIEKTIHSIGIEERREAESNVCSSDLCYKAAEKLINDNNIDKSLINALIFISQTPDYRQPATAPCLQYRLGLSLSTMAFDINLACSGYVYGLSIAFALANQSGINSVLLLVGETMSKTISKKDRNTTPLFGDAGTASLITKDEKFGVSYFIVNSDGSGANALRIPFGGYRQPSCSEGLRETQDIKENILTGEQLHMQGMDVFTFGLRVVSKSIKDILENTRIQIGDIDLILFHQANKFMTDFFAKKLKFPLSKIPYNIRHFGNTSAASIPLNIVSEMHGSNFIQRNKVIMAGFGAGLSWGTCLLSLKATNISELIEY
ncbi:3-oxoacyl-[acyl-carrier-protein] synthase 3 [termite gut metagenome]|uniref:3-oxoacyl-[acyl-carrier-protein] synthase 3 n=1 Tax=termite gut metagenome TaxID=433724 RepID=A0A5J4R7J0_9ZZZZ